MINDLFGLNTYNRDRGGEKTSPNKKIVCYKKTFLLKKCFSLTHSLASDANSFTCPVSDATSFMQTQTTERLTTAIVAYCGIILKKLQAGTGKANRKVSICMVPVEMKSTTIEQFSGPKWNTGNSCSQGYRALNSKSQNLNSKSQNGRIVKAKILAL